MALKRSISMLKVHCMKSQTRLRQMLPNPSMPLRFVQFLRGKDKRKHLGVVSDDGKTLVPLSLGCCCSNDMKTFIMQKIDIPELTHKIRNQPSERVNDQMTLLPPITNPEKIICIGLNYLDRCHELCTRIPNKPTFFSKYASCLVGPTDDVIAHKVSKKIDWEVELAVIIGKQAKCVPKSKAFDYIFGYSVAQDISARDWQQKSDGNHYLIAKSMDSFCPLGPSIVHKSVIENPHDLQLITKVNGEQKQIGNTKDMIFKIDDIIHILTQSITLKPGDVILTGTPAGCGSCKSPPEYLKPGDVIESQVQSIGKLINPVVFDY